MQKKSVKHPREMKSDELVQHLFHPKIVKHLKGIVRKHNAKQKKGAATK